MKNWPFTEEIGQGPRSIIRQDIMQLPNVKNCMTKDDTITIVDSFNVKHPDEKHSVNIPLVEDIIKNYSKGAGFVIESMTSKRVQIKNTDTYHLIYTIHNFDKIK